MWQIHYYTMLLRPTCIEPTRVIYPLDYLRVADAKQHQLLEAIMFDVAEFCQVQVDGVSFRGLWDRSPPPDAAGKSLKEYMQSVKLLPNGALVSQAKVSSRSAAIHSSTISITTPMIFALPTGKDMAERLLQTRSPVGDGSAPLAY